MCDALISDRGNDGDVGCAAAQCLCALRWHGERKLVLAVERAIRKAPHQRRGVQILHDRYAEFGQGVRPKSKSPLPKAGVTGACGSRGQYSRRDFAPRKHAFVVKLFRRFAAADFGGVKNVEAFAFAGVTRSFSLVAARVFPIARRRASTIAHHRRENRLRAKAPRILYIGTALMILEVTFAAGRERPIDLLCALRR